MDFIGFITQPLTPLFVAPSRCATTQ